ncbi:SsrA-binding protein SmpB [Patescibacteria group bacterium]|nr:SsrA-binding protein SmpB [Patescibacteria group bacterium]
MAFLMENKKARFDYQILETFEAGIVLNGQEVKSIITGKANMAGAFVLIRPKEATLINFKILPYQPKNLGSDFKEDRSRQLLLHKDQLKYLIGKSKEGGLSIIPLTIYKKNSKIKLTIGLAKHKKKQDKREDIKKRDVERHIKRIVG